MTTETYGNQLKGIAIKLNQLTSIINRKPKQEEDSLISTFRKAPVLLLIRKQIENNENTNIVIKIADWTMNCHLLVLKCYSDYFKRISPDQKPTVELPYKRVSEKTFTIIYEWMLTDDPILKREDIIEIFISACYLEIEPLVAQIWECLSDTVQIRDSSAFFLYLEATICKVDCVKEIMMKRISKFFLIMVSFKEFLLMPFEDLYFILGSNNIGVNTEIEVFMAAIRWLHFDCSQRKKFHYKLMKAVRFNLIPPGFLIELDRNMIENEFIKNVIENPKIRNLIRNGLKYATTLLCYGNIVKQSMCKDKLLNKTKRRWLYDEKCEYHIRSNQLIEYKITYEKFLEYMIFLKESKSDHWEAFIDIKAEDYRPPNFMEIREFQVCEVKETRYAYVIKEITETEISHQDLQNSLSRSTLYHQQSKSKESDINIRNTASSLVQCKSSFRDCESFDEKSCELASRNILKHSKKKNENMIYQSFKESIDSASGSYISLKNGSKTEEYKLCTHSQTEEMFYEEHEIEKQVNQSNETCKVQLLSDEHEALNIKNDVEINETPHTSLQISKSANNEPSISLRPYNIKKRLYPRSTFKLKDIRLGLKSSKQYKIKFKNFKNPICKKLKCDCEYENAVIAEIQNTEKNDNKETKLSNPINGSLHEINVENQNFLSSININNVNNEFHSLIPKTVDDVNAAFQSTKCGKVFPEKCAFLQRSKSEPNIKNFTIISHKPDAANFEIVNGKKIDDVGDELQSLKSKETLKETRQNSLVKVTFKEIFTGFETLNLGNQENLRSEFCTSMKNNDRSSTTEIKTRFTEQIKSDFFYKSIFKNKTLLVLGGTDPYNQHANYLDPKYGMNIVDKVLLYNEKLKQWTQLPHTAFGTRHHHAAVVCSGLVYIVGGTKVIPGCKKTFFETSIWVLNPKNKKWSFETNLPKNRRDFAVIAIEGRYGNTGFFIIGGETFDRVPLSSVWFYNILQKSWERKAPLKTGRYGFAAAVVKNEIWIGGGIAYSGSPNCIESSGDASARSFCEFITDTIECYNLESSFKSNEKAKKQSLEEQWVQSKHRLRQPCLFGRFCVTKNNELFLIGGIGHNTKSDVTLTSFNAIDRFDFKSESWIQCGETKHGHDVALIEDCIAIIGGVSSKEKCAMRDIEFFSTKTSQTFHLIPSLPWALSGLTAVVVRGEW